MRHQGRRFWQTDIKNAIEKNINGELDLDGYSEELSNSFKQFLTRQEFRIVKTILEKIEIEELNQKEIRIGAEISKESETG